MKLTLRLLLVFFLVFSGGFLYLVHWMLEGLRPRYLEATEEVMVDTSQVLAAEVEEDLQDGKIRTDRLAGLLQRVEQKTFTAPIYGLVKTRAVLRVYVTDAKGKVLFDSAGKDAGQDYSRWNDVLRTLRGQYGARSTRTNPEDPASAVLQVAAPIRWKDRLVGVVSVGKSADSIGLFLSQARQKIIETSVLVLLSALLLGFLLFQWLVRPIHLLTRYARQVRDGEKTAMPPLGKNEIGDLGNAFEEMREALEGKRYVERYVEHLTHELKGPLTAIQGAAELLQEKVEPAQRKIFLRNIQAETKRMRDLVDRLLQLSSLEHQTSLAKWETLDLSALVKEALEPFLLQGKKVRWNAQFPAGGWVRGDRFLLLTALTNLIQNAQDFSPAEGTITLGAEVREAQVVFRITDEGPGLPDYAAPRVFDRFYSLPRPDTGRKSSGLGLNFVLEIVHLHGGTITLTNRLPQGAEAVLTLPLSSPA